MDVCDWVGVHFCQKNAQCSKAEEGITKNIKMKYFVRTIFLFSLPLPINLGLMDRNGGKGTGGRVGDFDWHAVQENTLPPRAKGHVCYLYYGYFS